MSWRPAHAGRLIAALVVFVVVAVVLSSVVVFSVLNLQTSSSRTYHAILADASGLHAGNNVKIAGLDVGRVKGVELYGASSVRVTFTVADDQEVDTDTHAQVNFADLIGTRYLALTRPTGQSGRPLPEDGTIPQSQTSPAIDLTAVFNGFQPLFAALTPDQINQLSASIITVFQGQSGDISHLVEQIATITTHLAKRKQVIGSVIHNLGQVLTKVNTQGQAVGSLIDNFNSVVDNLAGQRQALATAITAMGRFTTNAAKLTQESSQAINGDITGVAQASKTLARNSDAINSMLANAPAALRGIDSTMDSGSYVRVYLCNLSLQTSGRLNLSLVPGLPAPQAPHDVAVPHGEVGAGGSSSEVCR